MKKNAQEVPKGVHLEPGEHVVTLVRQHWVVFRDPFIIMFFVPFILLSGSFFLEFADLPVALSKMLGQLSLYGTAATFILGLILFLWKFYLWKETFYLLTNKRLVLITQHNLFSHADREASLSRIQDVSASVEGLQASLYGYGEVRVQVASKDARLVLKKVAHPREVQHEIVREAHLRDDGHTGPI